MTKLDVITIIGDVLTELDVVLSNPKLDSSSPEWHQLYAMRKHLDGLQREIVQTMFQEDDQEFQELADQIESQNEQMQKVLSDINQIQAVIQTVASIASVADQLIGMVK